MIGGALDITITDHLLSTTRAVRRRLDLERPVEREVILECLRLAVQAPTGANRQAWRWLVVTDPNLRAALAKIYWEAGAARFEAGIAASEPGTQRRRMYEDSKYLGEVMGQVPAIVVPCIEGRPEGGAQLPGFFGSIIPACWSFLLALRSRGLGSVWTTLHLVNEAESAALLGVPEDYTQVALLPVAYTIGDSFRPARRRPVEELTYWDQWGRLE
jgi:nitroreductase